MVRPVGGYDSITEAVADLAGRGFSARRIATTLGVDRSTVAGTIKRLADGAAAPRRKAGLAERGVWIVELDRALEEKLRAPARARGMTPTSLVRDLLATIVEDDLITAVLDDDVDDGEGEA